MSLTRRLALLAATALALAGCNIRFDFDDVRGADLVYVDGDGTWWIVDDPEPLWTQPDDGWMIPVPADYDGDGTTEPASYSADSGTWHTDGARGSFTFAGPGPVAVDLYDANLVPVPGDYDGDGTDEPAFFDEHTATWHIEGTAPMAFGAPRRGPYPTSGQWRSLHDIAAPADYDGDGDWDPAVYRPETGELLIDGTSTPVATGVRYGLPTPGNYTDDPGDEIAVYEELLGFLVDGDSERWESPFFASLPAPANYDPADGLDELAAVSIGGSGNWLQWEIDGVGQSSQVQSGRPWAHGSVAIASPSVLLNALSTTARWRDCVLDPHPICPERSPVAMDVAHGWFEYAVPELGANETFWTGPPGGVPVTSDYDGDGDPEYAAYDPTTGQWVTDGTRGTFTFAAPADTDTDPTTGVHAVPGDYDGDGDTDPAWFRDADATWHIEGIGTLQHGRSTTTTPTFDGHPVHDIPTPGDFDGDGTWELATYRIDHGTFHVAGEPAPVDPGWPAGIPLVADWDGDDTDDLGLWDDTGTGTWYRDGHAPSTPWGARTGLPIPAQWIVGGGAELSLLEGEPSGYLTWHIPGRWADPVAPSLYEVEIEPEPYERPAVGRPEIYSSRAFITAYTDYCVLGTPDPGECA